MQPFQKANWYDSLIGYLLINKTDTKPSERDSALAAFRAITSHAQQYEVRGSRVGFAAWEAMLDQLEHDDFADCKLLLPSQGEAWEGDPWNGTLQGRFFIYCDALCQVHERGVALPYYQRLAETYPEWKAQLLPAIEAWRICSRYGGYLWQYVSMSPEGYEKFRDPQIRKILADEGRRSLQKDIEATQHIKTLLINESSHSCDDSITGFIPPQSPVEKRRR